MEQSIDVNKSNPSTATPKRFSFLDKLDNRRYSAPGRLDNTNFIAFSATERQGISGVARADNTSTGKRSYDTMMSESVSKNDSKIDLDALERKNKKERRKSLTPVNTTSKSHVTSLNSLQSIFSINKK